VLQVTIEAFEKSDGASIPLREIADGFNARHASDYNRFLSNKAIGTVLRKRLRLQTQKSRGVYVVPASELPKIDVLAKRFGVERLGTTP